MIGYLLDTHTFLWAVHEDAGRKLSDKVSMAIENDKIPLYVSAVSAYEITNKHRLGKLPEYDYVVENYHNILRDLGADELSINTNHAHLAGTMGWTHRDPFDRLLAAQALTDNLTLITNDPAFNSLERIQLMW